MKAVPVRVKLHTLRKSTIALRNENDLQQANYNFTGQPMQVPAATAVHPRSYLKPGRIF
jgi:hypothetical protein